MDKNADLSTKENSSSILDSSWTHVKSNVLTTSHILKISNASFFCQSDDKCLSSVEFAAGINDERKWFIELIISEDNNVNVNLSFRYPQRSIKVRTNYKIIIYDCKMNEAKSISDYFVFTEELNSVSQVIGKVDEIFSSDKKILLNDELTIGCEIKFIDSVMKINGLKRNSKFINTKLERPMILDIMHESKKLSDITINIAGGTFQAHKAILGTASSIFTAMFENAIKENNININDNDMDKKTFEEILRFIYTGKINDIDDVIYKLYNAAIRYQILALKQECEKYFYKNLTIENAIKILILADRHRSNPLKENVIEFIKIHFAHLIKTKEFDSLMDSHRHLITEIMCFLAAK